MHAIPKPANEFTNGGTKLYDAHGDTVGPTSTPTLMARLEKAASQKVELSRGTVWLIGTGLVLATVIFTYGSSVVGWVRADEGIKLNQGVMQKDMEEIRTDLKELKTQFGDLQKVLQAQAVKDAEQKGKEFGYGVRQKDDQENHK